MRPVKIDYWQEKIQGGEKFSFQFILAFACSIVLGLIFWFLSEKNDFLGILAGAFCMGFVYAFRDWCMRSDLVTREGALLQVIFVYCCVLIFLLYKDFM